MVISIETHKNHQMTFGKNLAIELNLYFEHNDDVMFRNINMTENRKRLREEETCEFMPLSKRINNLHINNSLTCTPLSQSSDSNQSNGVNTENGIPSPCSSSESERRPSYDPVINSNDNSYYYENKLLFELHLERLQRMGQQFLY